MYINYAKTIYEDLIANEFRLFADDVSYQLTSDTIFIPLTKSIGSILYAVFIINTDKTNSEFLNATIGQYKQLYLTNKDSFHCDTVIFISLLLTENADTVSKQITVNRFIAGLDFYNINWVIDIVSPKLIVPEGETDDLLRLNSTIQASLSKVSLYYNSASSQTDDILSSLHETNLYDLQKEIRQKSSLTVKSKNTLLTISIILVNFFVLILMELLLGRGSSYNEQALLMLGANNYRKIVDNHEFYRLITSMFLHIGFFHFAVNSLSLYIYGTRVEKYYGKANFFIIYILSGIAASSVSVIATRITSAGASGAIFGLLGSLLALTKKSRKTVEGLNLYVICMLTISSIGFGFITPGVDNYAHIGGFIAGFIIGGFMSD